MSQRTAKRDGAQLNTRQQLLSRQLHAEYKRKRAAMLFDYYTEIGWVAQRKCQDVPGGLVLLDGIGQEHSTDGGSGIRERETDYQVTGKRPILSIVRSSDPGRVETGIPEPVQEQKVEDRGARR
jgi:hypothetical protein